MSVADSLVAGTVAGIAQVLVGQPFDLVKVRQQSSLTPTSTLSVVRGVFAESPLAFYKGSVLPLVGIGACVSLQFAGLGLGKAYFQRGKSTLTPVELYLAGATAGVGNSVVSCPVEHIRIRLQTQPAIGGAYTGPLDALAKIYRTDGLRGWFRGSGTTLAREFQGYGAYFLTYEYLVQREMTQKEVTRKQLSLSSSMIYGALAGWAMWLTNYPLDVIKSKLQTDGLPSEGSKRKYANGLDCGRKVWTAEGWKGFTRGLTPTLIRSPFVNAATFVVFESVMRQLE